MYNYINIYLIGFSVTLKFLCVSNNGAKSLAFCKSNGVSISRLLFIGITTTPNLKNNSYSVNKLSLINN